LFIGCFSLGSPRTSTSPTPGTHRRHHPTPAALLLRLRTSLMLPIKYPGSPSSPARRPCFPRRRRPPE
jgi:hypothetical protein